MRHRAKLVLFALVLSYGSFYLCRANVEAAFPLLTKAFGFTRTQLGVLSSIPIAVYAVSKVITGALGDVIGGRRLILLATAGSVLATLAFGASSSLTAFIIFASLNRFFQSGGWSGSVNVVAQHFERKNHGLVMGILSTSYELGNVFALVVSAAIAALLPGWRPLFVVNPLLFAAVGLVVASLLRVPPEATGGASPALSTSASLPASPPTSPSSPRAEDASLVGIIFHLLTTPSFWLAVLLSILLTFLRIGFLTWTPIYLYELSSGTPVSMALFQSAIFPAAGVVAALAVGALSDRFGPGRRAPVMAASLAMVAVFILTLAHGAVRSPLPAALLIGGVGLFLLGPYSLLSGAVALDVSGKRGGATAAGIIDGAGYLGASASGIVIGLVVDARGWSSAFDILGAAALASTVVTAAWSFAVLRRAHGQAAH